MKLDAFTKEHMIIWAKRFFVYTWEERCEEVVKWLEALSKEDFEYYLDSGWENTFRAARQYQLD